MFIISGLRSIEYRSLNFFSVAGEREGEVNKTQRISAKIDTFRTTLIVWILMQLI